MDRRDYPAATGAASPSSGSFTVEIASIRVARRSDSMNDATQTHRAALGRTVPFVSPSFLSEKPCTRFGLVSER